MNFNVDHIFSVKEKKNSFMEKRYSYILAYRVKIELVLKIRNHNGSTVEQLL